MAREVVMPALGLSQETGLLRQWLKAEGEAVVAGQPLMEIETDKAIVEVEAPASGVLAGIRARPGDEIPVGQAIALILAPGEPMPSQPELTGDQRRSAPAPFLAPPPPSVPPSISSPKGRIPASPKARRLAGERGLELQLIPGSGPEGAILAADVLAAVDRPAPGAAVQPVGHAWQVMVQRLSQCWREVPHFYLAVEARASQLIHWREEARQKLEKEVTFTDLFVLLAALSLRQHPRLNARWEDGGIALNEEINVGLAVAVEDGLVVPVIHRADRLGLAGLAARRQEVVERARTHALTLDDLRGGTFTLSNLGNYGIDAFSAILNPPQAAILAVGRIADRVVPVDGRPAVQPMVTLTLSCDHRVVDGVRAAQFLQTLVGLIEDPLQLLLKI